jgi:hypothetical protein
LQEIRIVLFYNQNIALDGTAALSSTGTVGTFDVGLTKLNDGAAKTGNYDHSWFLGYCASFPCQCSTSTCSTNSDGTTVADQCYIQYCNKHSDLRSSHCNGATCVEGQQSWKQCSCDLHRVTRSCTCHGTSTSCNTGGCGWCGCGSAGGSCSLTCNAGSNRCNTEDGQCTCPGYRPHTCKTYRNEEWRCKNYWSNNYQHQGHRDGQARLQSCSNLYFMDSKPAYPCWLAFCNAYSALRTTHCGGARCTTSAQATSCKTFWSSNYGPTVIQTNRAHSLGEYALELCLGWQSSSVFQAFQMAMTGISEY